MSFTTHFQGDVEYSPAQLKQQALDRIRRLKRQHEEAMLRAQSLRSEMNEAAEGAAGVASPEEIAEALRAPQ